MPHFARIIVETVLLGEHLAVDTTFVPRIANYRVQLDQSDIAANRREPHHHNHRSQGLYLFFFVCQTVVSSDF